MAQAVEVALDAGVLLALMLFVTAVLRYELGLGTLVSGMTAISVTAAGLMAAVALQVAVDVPFRWSMAILGGLVGLFLLLYEMAT